MATTSNLKLPPKNDNIYRKKDNATFVKELYEMYSHLEQTSIKTLKKRKAPPLQLSDILEK